MLQFNLSRRIVISLLVIAMLCIANLATSLLGSVSEVLDRIEIRVKDPAGGRITIEEDLGFHTPPKNVPSLRDGDRYV